MRPSTAPAAGDVPADAPKTAMFLNGMSQFAQEQVIVTVGAAIAAWEAPSGVCFRSCRFCGCLGGVSESRVLFAPGGVIVLQRARYASPDGKPPSFGKKQVFVVPKNGVVMSDRGQQVLIVHPEERAHPYGTSVAAFPGSCALRWRFADDVVPYSPCQMYKSFAIQSCMWLGVEADGIEGIGWGRKKNGFSINLNSYNPPLVCVWR